MERKAPRMRAARIRASFKCAGGRIDIVYEQRFSSTLFEANREQTSVSVRKRGRRDGSRMSHCISRTPLSPLNDQEM